MLGEGLNVYSCKVSICTGDEWYADISHYEYITSFRGVPTRKKD